MLAGQALAWYGIALAPRNRAVPVGSSAQGSSSPY